MYSSPIWEQIGKQPNANPTDGILTAGKIAVLQNQKPFTVQSVVTLRCLVPRFSCLLRIHFSVKLQHRLFLTRLLELAIIIFSHDFLTNVN